jgi:hypothetical protein
VIEATKGGVTLASTTGTQEELNEALGITAEEAAADAAAAAKDAPVAVPDRDAAKTDPDLEPDEEHKGETEEQRNTRKGGWQRKIEKQGKTIQTLEDTLREERLARQRLEAQLAGKPVKTGTETAEAGEKNEDPEPSEEVNPKTGKPWQDWKEFSRAHAAWAYRQEQAKAQERSAAKSEETQMAENFKAHTERIKAAEAKYDDWDEVAETAHNGQLSEAVGLAIIELDNGADVLYKLAKDPELLKQVQGMTDVRAIAKLGAISAALTGEKPVTKDTSPPKEKPKSSAPAPITPVDASSTKAALDTSKMSIGDYIKGRNEGRIK